MPVRKWCPSLWQALCVTLGMSLIPVTALSVQNREQYMKCGEAQAVRQFKCIQQPVHLWGEANSDPKRSPSRSTQHSTWICSDFSRLNAVTPFYTTLEMSPCFSVCEYMRKTEESRQESVFHCYKVTPSAGIPGLFLDSKQTICTHIQCVYNVARKPGWTPEPHSGSRLALHTLLVVFTLFILFSALIQRCQQLLHL